MRFEARRILEARLRAGYSQSDLAAAMRQHGYRTDASSISRWERGEHVPGADAVAAIASATGHPVEFFYTETPNDESEGEDVAVELLRALRPLAEYVLARA